MDDALRPRRPAGRLLLRLRLAVAVGLVVSLSAGVARAADPEAEPPRVPVDEALASLEPWLRHEDWTVRSIAGFELRRRSETGVIHLAACLLVKEKHPYAAAGALGALRGRPRRELVMEGGAPLADALLRWARCEHPVVAAHAREVLKTLPPVKLGDDLGRYDGWIERGRGALVREQRAFLAETARAARKPAQDPAAKSTSVETTKPADRFYGRMELMRKHGLELCIVMDHTGSMGRVIGAAKAGAARLIRQLQAYVPRFRAGLVTYDDGARVRSALTSDPVILGKALGKVSAGGGGDIEEGVDKGIRMALAQERLGWSQRAYRVIVVVGDAPPHEGDVNGLFRALRKARDDALYDKPVVVHTVSTDALPVLHFPQIARAGGGQHVTLKQTGRLVEELVLLTFGGDDRERVRSWMAEIETLRAAEPPRRR